MQLASYLARSAGRLSRCLGSQIGSLLMIQLDSVGLRRAIGIILLGMATQRVYANCSCRHPSVAPAGPAAEPPPKTDLVPAQEPDSETASSGIDVCNPRIAGSVMLWFGLAGLMGGVTSIGGPPMMIFVSLHQDEIQLPGWRGSNAVLRLLLNLSRGAVFVGKGLLRPSASWPLDAGMVAGGLLGLLAGNRMAASFANGRDLHWCARSACSTGSLARCV
jgi:uncharacterized membrane protein YfcA